MQDYSKPLAEKLSGGNSLSFQLPNFFHSGFSSSEVSIVLLQLFLVISAGHSVWWLPQLLGHHSKRDVKP